MERFLERTVALMFEMTLVPALPGNEGVTLTICHTTEDEFEELLKQDKTPILSRYFEWDPATGELFVMELCNKGHFYMSQAFRLWHESNPILMECFYAHGATCTPSVKPMMEPDERLSPRWRVMEPLEYPIPSGFTSWRDVTTLEIEVGVTQTWGDYVGSLDWKACTRWSKVPGVAYVLCIHTDSQLTQAEYKLYHIDPTHGAVLSVPQPIPIVAPQTAVDLDAHRLLSIPQDSPLPVMLTPTNTMVLSTDVAAATEDQVAFPDVVRIDLYELLLQARANMHRHSRRE